MNLQQTDRQTTVQLQQLKVSHVIGNVKCWIGPLLRNGRVYRLLTGQTRVNSGKQAPAKKVPLSDISITVQFNLKKQLSDVTFSFDAILDINISLLIIFTGIWKHKRR